MVRAGGALRRGALPLRGEDRERLVKECVEVGPPPARGGHALLHALGGAVHVEPGLGGHTGTDENDTGANGVKVHAVASRAPADPLLGAVLIDGAEPEDRTAALTGLLSASGGLPTPHRSIPWTGKVDKRAKELERSSWGAEAVNGAVLRTVAAISAGTVAEVTARPELARLTRHRLPQGPTARVAPEAERRGSPLLRISGGAGISRTAPPAHLLASRCAALHGGLPSLLSRGQPCLRLLSCVPSAAAIDTSSPTW